MKQITPQRPRSEDLPLHASFEGLAEIGERLRAANSDNRQFDPQLQVLLLALQTVLNRLLRDYGDLIEQVVAAGDWALAGIDLREAAYEEMILQIVLRSSEHPASLRFELAKRVFGDLDDDDSFLQFQLLTLPEWRHAVARAGAGSGEHILGVPLLTRG